MDPLSMVALLAVILIAVGILIGHLPVEECPECQHCRAVRQAEERARQLAHDRDHPTYRSGCLRCEERRLRHE